MKSVENEFLGYHCLEAKQDILIDSEPDKYEGEWIIDSKIIALSIYYLNMNFLLILQLL